MHRRLISLPIEIYLYTIEIFFSLSLIRLRNVCQISISINRLFESTYRMYESLMSIKHVTKNIM